MLVLARKKKESILIDGRVRVTVVETGNNTVRIGIEAPPDVPIIRSELQDAQLVGAAEHHGELLEVGA